MQKTKKIKKSSISAAEFGIIERLRSNEVKVFNADTLQKILGWKKEKIYQAVHRMKAKGIVSEIGGGKYIMSSAEMDIYQTACRIIWQSYISFWSALSYYKFTEQLPRTVFLATTKARKTLKVNNTPLVFAKLSEKRFFGYEKTDDIVIASREKAIIDSILFSRYAGGIAEVFKCLKSAWSELDKNILIDYAFRAKNKSLLKRLGFLIEKGSLDIDANLIKKINAKIGTGFSKLDPQRKKTGVYNKKWWLILNTELIE